LRDSQEHGPTDTGDLDILTELAGLSLDLDGVDEELLEGGSVELTHEKITSSVHAPITSILIDPTHDLVVGGSREVDDEGLGSGLGGSSLSSDLLDSGLGLLDIPSVCLLASSEWYSPVVGDRGHRGEDGGGR
jgi:hypothetical protein